MAEIKNNIKYYRNLKGMTQHELAKKVHVQDTTISNYEKGRRTPSIDMLQNIANCLDVSVDQLIGEKSSNFTSDNNSKHSELRRNIKVRDIGKDINVKYIIFKVILLVLSIISSFLLKTYDNVFFALILLAWLMVILIDVLKLLFLKNNFVEYSVGMENEIVFVNSSSEANKRFSWYFSIYFFLFALLAISSTVFQVVNSFGTENYLDTVYAFFVLTILGVGIWEIHIGLIEKKNKIKISEKDFTKFNTVIHLKMTLLLTELLFLYSYIVAIYYQNNLDGELYWVFLGYSALLIISALIFIHEKVKYLSNFKININK